MEHLSAQVMAIILSAQLVTFHARIHLDIVDTVRSAFRADIETKII